VKNGRLAMLAFSGMVTQAVLTGACTAPREPAARALMWPARVARAADVRPGLREYATA